MAWSWRNAGKWWNILEQWNIFLSRLLVRSESEKKKTSTRKQKIKVEFFSFYILSPEHYGSEQFKHPIIQSSTFPWAWEWVTEPSGACKWSEQCGASKWVNGARERETIASKWANRRASGSEFMSGFLIVPDHSAESGRKRRLRRAPCAIPHSN